MPAPPAIDEPRALGHLMDLLAIEGLSGREGAVARAVRGKLRAAGCRASWIRHDDAHHRIPGNYQVGNLIVRLPGTRSGERRLFSGHLDTVPLCRGAEPAIRGRRIVSAGDTALGGDNRTAVAALVTMVETVLGSDFDYPPTTVLFTVGEEVGLWGARTVELEDLGRPSLGFNVDGGKPARVVTAAIGADRWEAHVHGRSSHAGVAPEDGVSAALVASRAIADVARRGFFGRIRKRRAVGTSNVGIVRGGEATNQVTDYVLVTGESRSHDADFVDEITEAYRQAFERAARSVESRRRRHARVDFRTARDYDAFRMPEDAAPIRLAFRCARRLRQRPIVTVSDGGLDANYLNAKGLPTVTLGAGQHRPHTTDEYVDLAEFFGGCRLLAAIMTAE